MSLFPSEVDALKSGKFIVRDHAIGHEINTFANEYVRSVDGLRPAQVGSQNPSQVNDVRNDAICWLTETAKTGNIKLFKEFERWKDVLAARLGVKFTDFSVQLARYSGQGARYIRHADVSLADIEESRNSQKTIRLFTLVYYLNPTWIPSDQGQLRIYQGFDGELFFDVDPVNDRLIIFPSSVEHEVLPSFASTRWAVTMWLYGYQKDVDNILQTQNKAVQPTDTNSIFVSIPCLRDSDVVNTVNDLFANASVPSLITVGICWQGDGSPPHVNIRQCREQVRWLLLDSSDAAGPMFARDLILKKLYFNERYIFQIDAHTRFTPKWDEILRVQLVLTENPKAIITCYPAPFTVDKESFKTEIKGDLERLPSPVLCADRFDENGFLRITGRTPKAFAVRPTRTFFWAAGFSFCDARAFFSSNPRPCLKNLFFGEETLMSLYFFKNGWDCYSPSCPNIVFHMWTSRTTFPQTQLLIEEHDKIKARAQYASILKTWREDQTTERSIQEYETLSGVDFQQRTINEKAKLGGRQSWTDYEISAPLPGKALDLIQSFMKT